MVSIKVKCHFMTKTSKEGIIYYQITYNRSVRLFKTDYRLLRYMNGIIKKVL